MCAVIDWLAIDAVVFDIGGVFVIPHPEPIRAALMRAGICLDATVDDAFHRAHYRGARAVADLPMPETDPAFWVEYQRAYLRDIGAVETDLERATTAWASMREHDVMSVWRWVQHDNVAALGRFAAAGVQLAIVSNNDGTAARQMQAFQVCQVGPGPLVPVAAIVDSGAVGVAKPDPAIFSPALAALGTTADRTLYVGDMVHADVRGARAAGMPVVQIDPYDFHGDFAHARAPHVAAIADALVG
jgi:putative hydrolase of the HAD superfamily